MPVYSNPLYTTAITGTLPDAETFSYITQDATYISNAYSSVNLSSQIEETIKRIVDQRVEELLSSKGFILGKFPEEVNSESFEKLIKE